MLSSNYPYITSTIIIINIWHTDVKRKVFIIDKDLVISGRVIITNREA